jgi:predicted NBD/HSP70 family sugar kinase
MEDDKLGRADLTQSAVLALLGRHGPMSRAAMARHLDLSPAGVGLVTKRLIEQGLVEPLEHGPSTGGRPGQLLGLVGTAGRAIGVKVAADRLTMVDMRLDGHVVASTVERFDASAPFAVAQLGSRLQTFDKEEQAPLLGVGICVPGVVDRPDLGNVDAPVLGWRDVPLGRHLRGVLGVPILVENGVKALAFGECLYGLGRARHTFVVLTIGRGIGFAYVAGGTVQRGAHGSAGEIGHVVVEADGPLCWCGRRGCLEAFAGSDGLITAARASGTLSRRDGMRRLAALADKGDPRAVAVYAKAAERLGRFLAGSIGALDPEVVLIAGEGSADWRHWEQPFLSALRANAPEWSRSLPVEVDSWEDTSWAQGAAAIVLATPFDEHPVAGRQWRQVLARLHGEDVS